MSYYFNKVLALDFDAAVAKVTEKLKDEGFAIITEIDVMKTSQGRHYAAVQRNRTGACARQS